MRTEVERGVPVMHGAFQFLGENEIKPELGAVAKHADELRVVIDRITANGVVQERYDRAARSMTEAVHAQADHLLQVYLKPASQMRRKLLRNDPSASEFVVRSSHRAYNRLITTALAMADEAAARRAVFVEAGFAENFPELLREAAEALRQSLAVRRSYVGRRAGATHEMMRDLVAGRELVRLLDALVTPWLRAHAPGKVGEWKSLTRFVRSAPVVKPEGGVGSEGGEGGAVRSGPANGEEHAA